MDTINCLSEQEWKDFHSGKLSASKKAAVDAHIAGCELCRTVAGGLALVSEEELASSLVRIERALTTKEKKQSLLIQLIPYAAAAIFIALISFTLYTQFPTKEMQAIKVEEPEKELPQNIDIPTSDAIKPKQKSIHRNRNNQEKTKIEPIIEQVSGGIKPEELSPNTNTKSEIISDVTASEADSDLGASTTVEDAKSTAAFEEVLNQDQFIKKESNLAKEKQLSKVSATKKGPILPAAQANNINNFSATNNLELNTNFVVEDSLLLIYKKATNLFAEKKYQECILFCDSLIKEGTVKFFESKIAFIKGRSLLALKGRGAAKNWLDTYNWIGGKKSEEYIQLKNEIKNWK